MTISEKVSKKEIAGTIAYMLGVRKDIIERDYGLETPGLLESLSENKDLTIIRYLCKLRTSLMENFKNTDYEIRYNLGNLNRLPDYYDVDNIQQLIEWGFPIIRLNYSASKYMEDITGFINQNISKCESYFEDWINFDYIRELFFVPKYTKKDVMKREFNKFNANRNFYPFQMYMHWKPSDRGNILYNDEKFLNFLYSIHKDKYDISKVTDASEDTKESIYEFIDNANKSVIAVDCENSDAFKLYGVLKNLSRESLESIEKIILYDDVNTSTAWQWLDKFTSIPVEYVDVERVSTMKSLVDVKMTAGICKCHYLYDVDSFILFSSDSDFWGVISSLPDANFLVMYEEEACGASMLEALESHNIRHCCIDDFCTGNSTELKRAVLLDKLEELLPRVVGMNSEELLDTVYSETKIYDTKNEKENFYNKYIKTLQLKMNELGEFYINICR